MEEIVRDVEWCEAELSAGRSLYRERIHLTRPLVIPHGGRVEHCHFTKDFEGPSVDGLEIVYTVDLRGGRIVKEKKIAHSGTAGS